MYNYIIIRIYIYMKMIYNEKVYVRLDRALYDPIEAAQVWYDTLSTYLVNLDLKPILEMNACLTCLTRVDS